MQAKEKIIKSLVDHGILPSSDVLENIESRLNAGEDPESLEQKLLASLSSENSTSSNPKISLEQNHLDSSLQQTSMAIVPTKKISPEQELATKTKQEQDLYNAHLSSGTTTTTTNPLSSENKQQKENQESNQENKVNNKALLAVKKQQEAHEVSFETTTDTNTKESEIFEKSKPISLDDIPDIEDEPQITYEVAVNHEHVPHKYKVQDFTNFFRSRLKFLEKIIRQHPEMKSVTSISRVLQKKEKEDTSIIGVVFDVATTKNGNIILTLEDLTGQMKVIITKNNKDAFEAASELIFDEVIGVRGMNSGDVIFANDIVWPDIPSGKQIKKSPVEEHAIFLSDIHVGSTYFLEKDFQKFIDWICAKTGSDQQKETAKKVKYIFIGNFIFCSINID